jgi:hypothetical protein
VTSELNISPGNMSRRYDGEMRERKEKYYCQNGYTKCVGTYTHTDTYTFEL